MLTSPKKLDEFFTKGLSFQSDREVVEAELRFLVEEAKKATDEEGRKRAVGMKEMRNKEGAGSSSRVGAPGMRLQVLVFAFDIVSYFVALYCVIVYCIV